MTDDQETPPEDQPNPLVRGIQQAPGAIDDTMARLNTMLEEAYADLKPGLQRGAMSAVSQLQKVLPPLTRAFVGFVNDEKKLREALRHAEDLLIKRGVKPSIARTATHLAASLARAAAQGLDDLGKRGKSDGEKS